MAKALEGIPNKLGTDCTASWRVNAHNEGFEFFVFCSFANFLGSFAAPDRLRAAATLIGVAATALAS